MGVVLFYHLTRSPIAATVHTLLARALTNGWRITVRGGDPARLDELDRLLWLGPEDEFLPHGRSGGKHDDDQPVLLTEGLALAPGTRALMAIDGAEVEPREAEGLDRVWILFDGSDPDALGFAREQWRRMAASGVASQYWSEDAGRWEKKMDRPAAPSHAASR